MFLMPRVFFSYTSGDRTLARRMAVDLVGSGLDVWLDEWEIKVGDSISQRIDQGLQAADFLVVLLTQRSIASGWVDKEWRSRIAKEAETKEVVILPVKADDCDIPPLLCDRKWADIRTDYDAGMAALREGIHWHFTNRLRSRLPHNLDEVPFMRLLLTDFQVDRQILVGLLSELLPPDAFLSRLREHLNDAKDGDTSELLFHHHYDGVTDLWTAEQMVFRKVVR